MADSGEPTLPGKREKSFAKEGLSEVVQKEQQIVSLLTLKLLLFSALPAKLGPPWPGCSRPAETAPGQEWTCLGTAVCLHTSGPCVSRLIFLVIIVVQCKGGGLGSLLSLQSLPPTNSHKGVVLFVFLFCLKQGDCFTNSLEEFIL